MSELKIALLGQPEIYHHNDLLTVPSRKALALLAYLATEGGLHEREKVARLLWPESDRTHGRSTLRVTLHYLRQILMGPAQTEQDSQILITQDLIGLDKHADIYLDLAVLETAWKMTQDLAIRQTLQGEVRKSVIAQLREAASLYRNSFMHDFTLRDTTDFDNWIGIQQSHWEQRAEQVFDYLSRLLQAEKNFEEAIETIQRWRTIDPLQEKYALRLMQLYFAVGNRVEALKTYEKYKEILYEELSAQPSTQVEALADLLSNDTVYTSDKDLITYAASYIYNTCQQQLLTLPFVGRTSELATLMNIYEDAEQGHPQVAMIEGESGIGKSRLSSVFLDWARARGADILESSVLLTTTASSYQPLRDALRTRLQQEKNLHQRINTFWFNEIIRFIPDLRDRYGDLLHPVLANETASSHLLEAIARLLQSLAEQKPLVLVIDDIQWIDEATLTLCVYLCRSWHKNSTPVLLLLQRRVETTTIEPALASWLSTVSKIVTCTRLELKTLSAQDVDQILAHLLGIDTETGTPDRDRQLNAKTTENNDLDKQRLSAWLFIQTQGQPFYIQAFLETLLNQGLLTTTFQTNKGWHFTIQRTLYKLEHLETYIPTNLHDQLQQRINLVSWQARDLLMAGSVLGNNFSFDDLCRVTEQSVETGLAALDELLNHRLFREARMQHNKAQSQRYDTPPAYTFTYNKMRDLVYNEASVARRHIFQQRAFTVTSCNLSDRINSKT